MAYTNVFQNIADIAPEAIDVLTNNLGFSRTVSRKYDKAWERKGGQIGDTYSIRIPGYYNRVAGAGAVPNGYNDTPVPVTLAQFNSSVVFTSKEMTLNVDDMKRNVLAPLLEPLWEGMDTDGLALTSSLSQFYGTVGTAISSLAPFLNGKAIMEIQSSKPAGQDCNACLNPLIEGGMVGGLAGYFVSNREKEDEFLKGKLGRNAGIDYFSTANVPSFVVGTWGASTPVVAATPGTTNGGNTVATTGWASGASTLNAGDCFTIAGVYAFNPANRLVTGSLKEFTVTTKVSDTTGAITMTFSPAMYVSGPLQNVSALPVATSAIYMWSSDGTSPLNTSTGKTILQNVLYYEDAFCLALADLDDVNGQGGAESQRIRDPRTNLNLRLTKWYDGIADQGILRADVLYGWAQPRPGFALRAIQ
jgi:hypothetical protein